MTEAQRTSGLERINVLTNRNHNLQALIGVYEISTVMEEDVLAQISENEKVIRDLIKATDKRYEFLFNFESGGWNSEYAFTMEEAQQLAKEKYANSTSIPNMKTFRVSTPSDYSNLLSMFN